MFLRSHYSAAPKGVTVQFDPALTIKKVLTNLLLLIVLQKKTEAYKVTVTNTGIGEEVTNVLLLTCTTEKGIHVNHSY